MFRKFYIKLTGDGAVGSIPPHPLNLEGKARNWVSSYLSFLDSIFHITADAAEAVALFYQQVSSDTSLNHHLCKGDHL